MEGVALDPVIPCPVCNGEGIRPGPKVCVRCGGVGRRAREDEARVIKSCSCGRAFHAEAWRDLPYVGPMEDGEGGELELRNCDCGSTIAIGRAELAELVAA